MRLSMWTLSTTILSDWFPVFNQVHKEARKCRNLNGSGQYLIGSMLSKRYLKQLNSVRNTTQDCFSCEFHGYNCKNLVRNKKQQIYFFQQNKSSFNPSLLFVAFECNSPVSIDGENRTSVSTKILSFSFKTISMVFSKIAAMILTKTQNIYLFVTSW